MSELGETEQRLQQGVNELAVAMGPLEDGRAHADWVLRDVHKHRFAVKGMIDFFSSLQNRVRREVERPYKKAQQGCIEGTTTITDALRGTENELGSNALRATNDLNERAGKLLDELGRLKQEDYIGLVIGALDVVRAYMEDIAAPIGVAEEIGNGIQSESYPAVVEHVMRYSDSL